MCACPGIIGAGLWQEMENMPTCPSQRLSWESSPSSPCKTSRGPGHGGIQGMQPLRQEATSRLCDLGRLPNLSESQ